MLITSLVLARIEEAGVMIAAHRRVLWPVCPKHTWASSSDASIYLGYLLLFGSAQISNRLRAVFAYVTDSFLTLSLYEGERSGMLILRILLCQFSYHSKLIPSWVFLVLLIKSRFVKRELCEQELVRLNTTSDNIYGILWSASSFKWCMKIAILETTGEPPSN